MTRLGCVLVTCLAFDASVLGALFTPRPALIWNASSSVPVGLYALHPAVPLRSGELVVVRPPKVLAGFMDRRRYLPVGVPLLKHVAALPGARVCREWAMVSVNGAVAGVALDRDRRGRPLPVWSGCRVVGPGEVFIMNRAADSLDGRYFGLLPATTIVARADPIWLSKRR